MKKNRNAHLEPFQEVIIIDESKYRTLKPNDVKVTEIGQKAFGLSSMPPAWTLPFVVISSDLIDNFRKCSLEKSVSTIKRWSSTVQQVLREIGIAESDSIIVRSSAISEGMEERGKFYSLSGTYKTLYNTLYNCILKITNDEELLSHKIPLIVQKYNESINFRGHLSNERRFYEEKRDWIGEYEDVNNNITKSFKINLRQWRKKIVYDDFLKSALLCNLSPLISEVLKIPSTWAYEKNLTLHFEWIWDGKTIYIVQADQERNSQGIDPTKAISEFPSTSIKFEPKFLKEITAVHAKKYHKIKNVFTYLNLNLPITKLYILDDRNTIKNLANNIIPTELEDDLRILVKNSLVIRTDIESDDTLKRQLLPRTEEIRDFKLAKKWLIDKSKLIEKQKLKENIAFIFHNFIPALASAFALAGPNERKVQIEALWGIPEGLYFNSHDKYIVDTTTPHENELKKKMNKFVVTERKYYKHFFISPDINGKWCFKILKPPYDWKGTIQNKDLLNQIAYESRKIAEYEGKPVSIMWFIDATIDGGKISFPWYHEPYDSKKTSRALSLRTKSIFDKTLNIKTAKDIEDLEKEAKNTQTKVKRVRIQLQEESLLRDKMIIKRIGELCHKINAVILLEGGVLSHVYYQLMDTKAIIEVLHPFEDTDDKREFFKLIRDKVAGNIEKGGEYVNKAKLSGDYLLQALREKLIEESFEALDAVGKDPMLDELADISEIIDNILQAISVSKDELIQRQKVKREKAGSFKSGIVLLDTLNPIITKKASNERIYNKKSEDNYHHIEGRILLNLSKSIDKHTDKRTLPFENEILMRLNVPLVIDNKSIINSETHTMLRDNNIRIRINGKRTGSKIQLEFSIFSESVQLSLPFTE